MQTIDGDLLAIKKGIIVHQVNMLANQKQLPIFVPFGIGCGLAGGDWDRVTDIINFAAPNCILVRK